MDMNQSGSKPRVAVVLEWDNAQEILDQDSLNYTKGLVERVKEGRALCATPIEMLIVFDPEEVPYERVNAHLSNIWSGAETWLSVHYISAPTANYYEKKSVAAFKTDADIIVYADSDCVYDEKWFEQLLAPFRDSAIALASGRTYAMPGNFLENVSAICWFFPTTSAKDTRAQTMPFFANNFAIRTQVMRDFPFVRQSEARIWGGEFIKTLKANNRQISYPQEATAKHKQLYTLSYMFRRAIKLGQHNDTWVALQKRASRRYRLRRGIFNLIKSQITFARRYRVLWQEANIKWYQAIPGYLLGVMFAAVSATAQIQSALTAQHKAAFHDYQSLLVNAETRPA